MSTDMEIGKILDARGAEYGDFTDQAVVAQELKRVVRGARSWDGMSAYQKEAVEMILHKISRMVNGNPLNLDTIDDIIGYAKLIGDRHREKMGKLDQDQSVCRMAQHAPQVY